MTGAGRDGVGLDMERPVLHKRWGCWMVGEYPLLIWRNREEGWQVVSGGSRSAGAWLKETGLKEQRFRTRGEAAEAVSGALEAYPGLEKMEKARCSRGEDGWRLEGGVKAMNQGGRWNMVDGEGRIVGVERTLQGAARRAQRMAG